MDRKLLVYDGKVLEVNVFNEEPLAVGEVTTYIGAVEEARRGLRSCWRELMLLRRSMGGGVSLSC